MRVAFVYTSTFKRPSANPFSALKNCEALCRLGCEVDLLVPYRLAGSVVRRRVIKLAEDFGVRDMPKVTPLRCLAVKNRGARTFSLHAALYCRRRKPNLVWSRDPYAAAYAVRLGCATILEYHTPLSPRAMTHVKTAANLPSFKAWVCISESHRRLEVAAGFPPEKLTVAHSGVDLLAFDAARVRPSRLDLPRPIAAYVGSFYPGRGHELLHDVARQMPEVTFLLVGGPDNRRLEVEGQARSRGISNVVFMPRIRAKEVPSLLCAADVLLAPYTERSESISGEIIASFFSPIKVLEYMAAGKPIIATTVGGIPEVLRDAKNALLVPPGDPEAIVEKLKQLQRDPDLARKLGRRAAEDAREFTWEARARRVLACAGLHAGMADKALIQAR